MSRNLARIFALVEMMPPQELELLIDHVEAQQAIDRGEVRDAHGAVIHRTDEYGNCLGEATDD